jgi:hypothetical protein
MKKTLFALAAASVLTLGIAGTPSPAQAGCGWGCGAAIGTGAVLGAAVIGSAIAEPPPGYYGYAPAPGYVAYSGYYGPQPVGCPGGLLGASSSLRSVGQSGGLESPEVFLPILIDARMAI